MNTFGVIQEILLQKRQLICYMLSLVTFCEVSSASNQVINGFILLYVSIHVLQMGFNYAGKKREISLLFGKKRKRNRKKKQCVHFTYCHLSPKKLTSYTHAIFHIIIIFSILTENQVHHQNQQKLNHHIRSGYCVIISACVF